MISKFNRDTGWLWAGVLAILVIAALVIAVQEHPPRAMSTGTSCRRPIARQGVGKESQPEPKK